MLWQEKAIAWGLANPIRYTVVIAVIVVIGVVFIIGRCYGIRLFKD